MRLLTYSNVNADRTTEQQLLHKSHCVTLPCPPHLHQVKQTKAKVGKYLIISY